MIGQVQLVNGQKDIVPLSGMIPVDVVEDRNQNAVTSNAVYNFVDNEVTNITGDIADMQATLSDTDMFKIVESNSVSVTIAANNQTAPTFTIQVPSGYYSVSLVQWDISGVNGAINLYATNSQSFIGKSGTFTAAAWFRNYSSTQQTASIKVYVLCWKMINQ